MGRFNAPEFKRGFTLLEMAAVLLLLAVMMGAGLSIANKKAVAENFNVTQKRLDKIEDALWKYRRAYNRLPIPARRDIGTANANYSQEDAGGANLSGAGGFTDANLYQGAVPVRALSLSDEYAIDGWGRKFTYVVARPLVAADSFTTYPITSTTYSTIDVRDGTGAIRTTSAKAAYVLFSHGKNGHGAYLKQGTLNNTTSSTYIGTSADERRNCVCDNNGIPDSGSSDGTYVQKENIPVTGINYFDDLVRYKTRFQIYSGTSRPEVPPVTPYAVSPY